MADKFSKMENNTTARELKSVEEIRAAQKNGELTIQKQVSL